MALDQGSQSEGQDSHIDNNVPTLMESAYLSITLGKLNGTHLFYYEVHLSASSLALYHSFSEEVSSKRRL